MNEDTEEFRRFVNVDADGAKAIAQQHFARTDYSWKPAAQLQVGDTIIVYDNFDRPQAVEVLRAQPDDGSMLLALDMPGRSTCSMLNSTAVASPLPASQDLPEQLQKGELD